MKAYLQTLALIITLVLFSILFAFSVTMEDRVSSSFLSPLSPLTHFCMPCRRMRERKQWGFGSSSTCESQAVYVYIPNNMGIIQIFWDTFYCMLANCKKTCLSLFLTNPSICPVLLNASVVLIVGAVLCVLAYGYIACEYVRRRV